MSRGKTAEERHLDQDERDLVRQSRAVANLSGDQLTDLLKRLRQKRDRAQRIVRGRTRSARGRGEAATPDTGAKEKKAVLAEAVTRTNDALKASKVENRRQAAADHLREAVARKAETQPWRGPDDRTASAGMIATPNTKIAPSGALHAEGMRAAISRSTGDR